MADAKIAADDLLLAPALADGDRRARDIKRGRLRTRVDLGADGEPVSLTYAFSDEAGEAGRALDLPLLTVLPIKGHAVG